MTGASPDDSGREVYESMDFDELFWLVHDGLKTLKREPVKSKYPHLLPEAEAEFESLIEVLYQHLRSIKLPTIPPLPTKPEVADYRESDQLVGLKEQHRALQKEVQDAKARPTNARLGKKKLNKLENRLWTTGEQVVQLEKQEKKDYKDNVARLLAPYKRGVAKRKQVIDGLSKDQIQALDFVAMRLKRVQRIEQRIAQHFKERNLIRKTSRRRTNRRRDRSSMLAKVPKAERLPWEVLPPGTLSSQQIIRHYRRLSESHPDVNLDMDRLNKVLSLRYENIYVGTGDMEKYIVLTFRHTERVLLECPVYGNAIYVLRGDWRKLSRLSKGELREQYSHQVIRIIHRPGWFYKLERALMR